MKCGACGFVCGPLVTGVYELGLIVLWGLVGRGRCGAGGFVCGLSGLTQQPGRRLKPADLRSYPAAGATGLIGRGGYGYTG